MPDAQWSVPVTYRPIGVIHSPHVVPQQTPVQPVFAEGIVGSVEILPEYAGGLKDIEAFSHLFLVFHFHKAQPAQLQRKPFLQDEVHGVFAMRAPNRPNPIGFSVVRLLRREGNVLHIADVDILDGTPLLDIKPYIARFDVRQDVRSGWQDKVDDETAMRQGRRGYEPQQP